MVAEPLSISALSVLTGRDRRTISAKLKNVKPLRKEGRSILYSPPDALAAIYNVDDQGALDHTHESARLKKAQADKTELEVSVLRGDLIHADEVSLDWAEMVTAFRSKILNLPATAAVRVVGLSLKEIETELKDLVFQALTELKESGNGASQRQRAGRDQGSDVRSGRAATAPDN